MVLTRDPSKRTFKHILNTVMAVADNEPLALALDRDGTHDIYALSSMSTAEVDALDYESPRDDGTTVVLPLGRSHRAMVHAFLGFILYRAQRNRPITENDWLHVTQQEFDDYRVSSDFILYRAQPRNPAIIPPSRASDSLTNFKRGIKRDVTTFLC